MRFLFYNFKRFYIHIILIFYKRRINKKETLLHELRNELDFQVECYRSILYSTREWALKYEDCNDYIEKKKT